MAAYNDRKKNAENILIIGHRGDMENCLDNSRQGYLSAIKAGADFVEIDVRLSKDNEIFSLHSNKIQWTTNGKGRLVELESSYLKSVRLKNGELGIPTLEEIVEIVVLKGKKGLNIEIKRENDPKRREIIINKIMGIIAERKIKDKVIISSFELDYLKVFLDNGIRCHGLFFDTQYEWKQSLHELLSLALSDRMVKKFIHKAKAHGLRAMALPFRLLNNKRIEMIQAAGLQSNTRYHGLFRPLQFFRYKSNAYKIIDMGISILVSNAPRIDAGVRAEIVGKNKKNKI